jgi:hypothetical protein
MKGIWCLLLPVVLGAPVRLRAQQRFQPGDSLKQKLNQPLTTYAPLLGGVNTSYIISPMSGSLTSQQVIVDESSPVYKVMKTKHPLLIKMGARYQGLFLSGDDQIGVTNFHAFSATFSATYVLSRNTNITGIGLAGVASDFRKDIDGQDIIYSAGIRWGFRQATKFKVGVTLLYSHSYSGNVLIPLPDIDWTISDKWELEGFMPFRTSLKYKLSKTETLALTQGYTIASYRLNDITGVGKYLESQQISTGLMYEHTFNRRWSTHLIAGYAVSSRLRTYNNDQTVGFDNFGALNKRVTDVSYDKGAFLGQFGVSYKF